MKTVCTNQEISKAKLTAISQTYLLIWVLLMKPLIRLQERERQRQRQTDRDRDRL